MTLTGKLIRKPIPDYMPEFSECFEEDKPLEDAPSPKGKPNYRKLSLNEYDSALNALENRNLIVYSCGYCESMGEKREGREEGGICKSNVRALIDGKCESNLEQGQYRDGVYVRCRKVSWEEGRKNPYRQVIVAKATELKRRPVRGTLDFGLRHGDIYVDFNADGTTEKTRVGSEESFILLDKFTFVAPLNEENLEFFLKELGYAEDAVKSAKAELKKHFGFENSN